ncbi:MAG: type I-U CRISPR-associated protein Csb2 [Myxococcales bacterium]|nr:type I-U CRISPR-associated protein Csb2 [Myxococcales bacterium]
MLALGIRYLNGFVAAAEPDSHERPEWPPHPARVFMALAAAHFETGADPAEREALEWLERLESPPRICAGEASPRALVTHYVPVNDKAGPAKAILQSAPALMRDRQERTFARAWLDDEVIYLSWPDVEAGAAREAVLDALCAKVTRIGHSASLVHMWLASPEEIKDPTWVPDAVRAEIQLRVVRPGTLEYLERCFNRQEVEQWEYLQVTAGDEADRPAPTRQKKSKKSKKEHPMGPPGRRRPELRIFEGYARFCPGTVTEVAPGSMFSPHLVVRTLERAEGPYQDLDLLCAPECIRQWRAAILAQSDDQPEAVKQMLSAHDREGIPLPGGHLAFVPLAFVGHPYADGHVMGMGLAFPAELPAEDRRQVLRAIARVDRLALGRLGTWRIGSVNALEPPYNLRAEVWTAHPKGATHWSSVTPIALDRPPREKDRGSQQREMAEMIAEAAVQVGLPRPREVIVTAVSAHWGVPPAPVFPRLQRRDGSQRHHTHAILGFAERVRGPILLGAGRYRGYGVCRPLDDEGR